MDLPNRMGTINNVEKFDADFFTLSFEQTNALSPDARLLLERSFEAIIDAGINPKQLRGKDTAVIIASSFLESHEKKILYENVQVKKLFEKNIINVVRRNHCIYCSKKIITR